MRFDVAVAVLEEDLLRGAEVALELRELGLLGAHIGAQGLHAAVEAHA